MQKILLLKMSAKLLDFAAFLFLFFNHLIF